MAILIQDPDDPRIAAFRHIKERDLVGREGQLIAEGEVVLRVLMASALYSPIAFLIAQKRLEALSALLEGTPAPVYAAGQDVLDAIAGFHLHRGILALARPRARPAAADLLAGLPARALVLVLMGLSNHDNMGGVFRNAAAFGADAVLIDETCCDPLYRKAIRVSVGGVLKVPYARLGKGEDVLSLLAARDFEVVALSPSGAQALTDYAPPNRVAALFGAEGPGLASELMARTRTLRIPMAPGFDSLNVATTSGIVLAHLRR